MLARTKKIGGKTVKFYKREKTPEPLNLEEIKDLIEKCGYGEIATTLAFKKIKQKLKSACEFYLRYKDKPDLLVKEHPQYKEAIEKLRWIPNQDFEACRKDWFKETYGEGVSCDCCPMQESCSEGEFIENIDFIKEYNTWLFKRSFSDVFTEFDTNIIGSKQGVSGCCNSTKKERGVNER